MELVLRMIANQMVMPTHRGNTLATVNDHYHRHDAEVLAIVE